MFFNPLHPAPAKIPSFLSRLLLRLVLQDVLRVALQIVQRLLAVVGGGIVGLGLALIVDVRGGGFLLLSALVLRVRGLAALLGGGHIGVCARLARRDFGRVVCGRLLWGDKSVALHQRLLYRCTEDYQPDGLSSGISEESLTLFRLCKFNL